MPRTRHRLVSAALAFVNIANTNVIPPRPYGLRALARAAAGGDREIEGDKEILLIRHGQTEMNAFLTKTPYGSSRFRDPGFYDTVLTREGIGQARSLNQDLRRTLSKDDVDLIMISPLTRTLQTARHVFDGFDSVPRLVVPQIREKLWLSSDVGSHPSRLSEMFPDIDFKHLDDFWWYQGDRHLPPPESWQVVHEEPDTKFVERLEKFREILRDRPEKNIAIVAHWGVLNSMTGLDFRNCEAKRIRFSELRPRFRPPGT
mmetsp:Transcript_20077/g.27977  ORF Transcript_20077/g.27977 Transcript_20077/m.27977 type:complete len:259 (-) Transcript_20077:182-958(-)